MNHKTQLAYYALWIAHPVLQLSVAAVMCLRKQRRAFPLFFTYILSQIVIFSVLLPIYRWGDSPLYFYGYWVCAGISLTLGFMVIHEIFLDIFRPYHTLRDLGSVLFKWAALVMLLVAGVVMAASPGANDPLVQAVLTGQRCVRVIQCGLVLFLLVFSKYLGVSWRQQSFGIALGFGGFASIELGASALYSAGQIGQITLSLANMIAYNCAILTWLGYALVKAPSKHVSSSLLTSQRWDHSLGDLQHPAAGDSLIPMFEGMVDRAFSRTNGESALHGTTVEHSTSRKMSRRDSLHPSWPPPSFASKV
jgi:hypothetical protein